MIELFIPYVLLVISIVFLKYFDNSLESVQMYHYRLIEYPWKGGDQLLLKYCCVASIIRVSPNIYPKLKNIGKINLIKGYNNNWNIETFGISFIKNKTMNLVFISTSNIDDVLTSLKLSRKETDYGMIHKGYIERFHKTYTSILSILNDNKYKFKDIKCYGHSLGGVMASLTGLFLSSELGYKCNVITFGSPRWGNEQVKNWVSLKSGILKMKNYINSADPIPQRPKSSKYVTIGTNIVSRIDTGNDNVNHGIKVYREIVIGNLDKCAIKSRGHRFDEIISRSVLDLFS